MGSLENRKQSFINYDWDQSIPVSVHELCESGFYYTGEDDIVECFHCTKRVDKWVEKDSSWKRNAEHSPYCHFLKIKIIEQFVGKCIAAGNTKDPSKKKTHNGKVLNLFIESQFYFQIKLIKNF
jgi:hypothetical protein